MIPVFHLSRDRQQIEALLKNLRLDPVELADGGRIAGHELRQIERAVAQYRLEFLEAWYDYFGH